MLVDRAARLGDAPGIQARRAGIQALELERQAMTERLADLNASIAELQPRYDAAAQLVARCEDHEKIHAPFTARVT